MGLLAVVCLGVCLGTASSAGAQPGGLYGGDYRGYITNLTPYTLHFDRAWGSGPSGATNLPEDPDHPIPQEIQPGESFNWVIYYNYDSQGTFTYFTFGLQYHADTTSGPEVLTFTVNGCPKQEYGARCDFRGYYYRGPDNHDLQISYTVTPASGGKAEIFPVRDSGGEYPPPYAPDVKWEVGGNFSLDAAKDSDNKAVADVVNALCDGSAGTTCAFKPTSPMLWGLGPATKAAQAEDCTRPSGSSQGSPGGGDATPPPPPELDPDWNELKYEQSQTASVSFGGGLTLSAEASIFKIVSVEVAVSVEAEHEWEQTKTFAKSSKVFIPLYHLAQIWTAPTEAKVVGTLVASQMNPEDPTSAVATYTISNFTEARSGVSRTFTETVDGVTRQVTQPAFNVIVINREMTPAEYQAKCLNGLGAPRTGIVDTPVTALGTPQPAPTKAVGPRSAPVRVSRPTPSSLYPGRGVARVTLSDSRAQVLGRLGAALYKTNAANDCFGLDPSCQATRGRQATWVYGQLDVWFGSGHRVSALVYRGQQTTVKGIGAGSSLAGLRSAYPHASCTRYAVQADCRLRGTYRGRPVMTVFHFYTAGGGWVCDDVMIYWVAARRGRAARAAREVLL